MHGCDAKQLQYTATASSLPCVALLFTLPRTALTDVDGSNPSGNQSGNSSGVLPQYTHRAAMNTAIALHCGSRKLTALKVHNAYI